MARASAYTLRFSCTHCGAVSKAKCRKCGTVRDLDLIKDPGDKWVSLPIYFTETDWQRIVDLAGATPGVDGPLELVNVALHRILSMPPIVLRRRPSMAAERPSAVNAQTSFEGRGTRRRSTS